MDSALHVIGCYKSQGTRVQTVFDDVASIINQSGEHYPSKWRALSIKVASTIHQKRLQTAFDDVAIIIHQSLC
jgi:hypothetical protein